MAASGRHVRSIGDGAPRLPVRLLAEHTVRGDRDRVPAWSDPVPGARNTRPRRRPVRGPLDPQWCVVTPHDVRALASVEDGESYVDPEVGRRYMKLYGAMVDATRLDQLPKSTPLIDDVLMRDSLAWLHGKPGHAKSFIALDWACCVATGRQWRGHAVEQGPVLFVVAEGAHGIHERRQAWEITNSTTMSLAGCCSCRWQCRC